MKFDPNPLRVVDWFIALIVISLIVSFIWSVMHRG